MSAAAFLRDKLLFLLADAFAVVFAAVLLWVLEIPAGSTAFLCAVLLFCALLPLWAEWARKGTFYQESMARLDALEEKHLFAELLDEPGFAEGAVFCAAIRTMSASMTQCVGDARRDMAEYREYIEQWVHEVKTPLASARLALENRPLEAKDAVEDALFQVDGYVEQALFYARSGAVEQDYLVKAVPLREVCAAAVKRQARPLIAAGFQIDVEGLDALVYSDSKWIEFILGQLISNALKYRSASPALTFRQTLSPDAVALHVCDNGAGIPESDLPRVFQKGFTGQNGRALSTKSTGLGLYLTQKLCRRLGLGVSIASTVGEGTTVTLAFPKGRFHLAD